MSSMKAVRFDKKGPVRDVLKIASVPKPVLAPGTCIVKILAAAINPSDTKNIEGLFPHTKPPLTPGRDFAGRIVQGPEALIGKAVWGTGGTNGFERDGTHAEYLDIPVSIVQEKPTNLSFGQAAAVCLPYLTAASMIKNIGPLDAGAPVLVLGSGGAVGSAAVALLRANGLNPIKSSSRPGNPGAVHTNAEDFAAELQKVAQIDSLAAVVDCVGDPVLFNKALFSLRRNGNYVTITAVKNKHEVSFDILQFYRKELHLHGVNTVLVTASEAAELLSSLRGKFETGKLPVPTDVIEVPFEDDDGVLEAFQSVSSQQPFRGKKGKLVVVSKDE